MRFTTRDSLGRAVRDRRRGCVLALGFGRLSVADQPREGESEWDVERTHPCIAMRPDTIAQVSPSDAPLPIRLARVVTTIGTETARKRPDKRDGETA